MSLGRVAIKSTGGAGGDTDVVKSFDIAKTGEILSIIHPGPISAFIKKRIVVTGMWRGMKGFVDPGGSDAQKGKQ